MTSAPRVPDGSAKLVAAVREPLRLEILLSLEERPGSAVDLAEELGEDYGKVSYAFRVLERTGLIEARPDVAARQRATTGRGLDLVKVYGTRHAGWSNVLRAFADVATTAE